MKNLIFEHTSDHLAMARQAHERFTKASDELDDWRRTGAQLEKERAKILDVGDPFSDRVIKRMVEINTQLQFQPKRFARCEKELSTAATGLISAMEKLARAARDAAEAEAAALLTKIVAVLRPYSPEVHEVRGTKIDTAEAAAQRCSILAHVRARAVLTMGFDSCADALRNVMEMPKKPDFFDNPKSTREQREAADYEEAFKNYEKSIQRKNEAIATLRTEYVRAALLIEDATKRGTFAAPDYANCK